MCQYGETEMSAEKPRRPYHMTARAEQQEQTRRRITESAVHLHGTLGPARTSMTAVAEHAGVRRSTLYRHFPDEASLFDACTAHWRAENPPPDLAAWAGIADPDERLHHGLAELHAFYTRTAPMLENLFRDEAVSPPVAERFAAFRGYLAQACETLMEGRELREPAAGLVRGAIAHAIGFSTWRSLVREHQVGDEDAVRLLCALVEAAARPAAPD